MTEKPTTDRNEAGFKVGTPNPLEGLAAASAVGFAMAAQAVDMWFGVVSGMARASQEMLNPNLDRKPGEPPAYVSTKKAAAVVALKPRAKQTAPMAAPVVKLLQPAKTIAALAVAPIAPEPPVKIAAIMPEDFRRPQAIEMPTTPDDLKLVSGVGPKLEKVLHGLGIWTFGQIAELAPEEIAWLDDYLGLDGRFGRDGWAEQAGMLAAGVPSAKRAGA